MHQIFAIFRYGCSQGSSATPLRCGGIVNDDVVAYLLMNLSSKKIWKSVNIWRSYGQYRSALFFDSQCICMHVLTRFFLCFFTLLCTVLYSIELPEWQINFIIKGKYRTKTTYLLHFVSETRLTIRPKCWSNKLRGDKNLNFSYHPAVCTKNLTSWSLTKPNQPNP